MTFTAVSAASANAIQRGGRGGLVFFSNRRSIAGCAREGITIEFRITFSIVLVYLLFGNVVRVMRLESIEMLAFRRKRVHRIWS